MDRFLNKITCGDNCDLLGELPRECIDLVVTSPPYDDLRTYGGHTWDFAKLVEQLFRVLKQGGLIVWVINDSTTNGCESGNSFRQALAFMDAGFNLHDTMIYQKSSCKAYDPRNMRYKQVFEYMFVFSKGKPKTYNPLKGVPCKKQHVIGMTSRKTDGTMRKHPQKIENNEVQDRFNVWVYETGFMLSTKDLVAFDHPAIFPDALARDHILSWSNPGDVVLDPFMGSGTVAKAAKNLERQYIGFEINPEYCEIGEARTAQEVLSFATV
jgi:site-specific DNA-methyltransferase (adenine-specific)